MDCPHCGTENLIGASLCAACGKSMVSRPKFAAAPHAAPAATPGVQHWNEPAPTPAPASAPEPQMSAICRACRTPFDRTDSAPDAAYCPSCSSVAATVAKQEPVPLPDSAAPAAEEQVPAGAAHRAGGADVRPRRVTVRRAGLRAGPVAAVVGLVLGLATLGVVAVRSHEPDRAGEILGSVRAEDAAVLSAPDEGFVAQIRSTVKLHVVRDEARPFSGGMSTALDVQQTSVQECEAAFVRAGSRGLVYDVTSEGQVKSQQGKVGADDAREAGIYPWSGRRGALRVVASPVTDLAQVDGTGTTAGMDVPPLFHLGALTPPRTEFLPGDRWKASVWVPLFADRDGHLAACQVPAELTFAGRAVRNGYACAAFRFTGTVPRALPGSTDRDYPRREGKVAGAVWFELATGIVAGAELEAELTLHRAAGEPESELRTSARLTVERR